MARHRVFALAPLLLIHACASPAPASSNNSNIAHLDESQQLECRIESLMYQDLARLRDAGQPSAAAQSRVYTQYQALATSVAARTAIDAASARRSEFADFVYAHTALHPQTLREAGSSICMLRSGGDDPAKVAAIGSAAESCQGNYPTGTPAAEDSVQNCLSIETAKLVPH